jgi:hypothetical protein
VRLSASPYSSCQLIGEQPVSGVATMTAVAVGRRARRSERRRVHQSRRCSGEPARSTLSNTESPFRLGDLVEALDRELPAVADLAVRLAIDLEVDQDIITQACS